MVVILVYRTDEHLVYHWSSPNNFIESQNKFKERLFSFILPSTIVKLKNDGPIRGNQFYRSLMCQFRDITLNVWRELTFVSYLKPNYVKRVTLTDEKVDSLLE